MRLGNEVFRGTEAREPGAAEAQLQADHGRPVELTPLEYDLLRTLSINAGRVTTHDSLIRQVWRDREYANPRLVRAFVKTLRRKLGDDPPRNAKTYQRARS